MEEFVQILLKIQDPKVLAKICAILIFGDVITGYLKAFKFRRVNSSISRDGYIKKVGWVIALLIGWLFDFAVGTKIMLVGSALVCVATEGISVYENLGEIGIKLRFRKYFAKLKDGVENED